MGPLERKNLLKKQFQEKKKQVLEKNSRIKPFKEFNIHIEAEAIEWYESSHNSGGAKIE